MTQNLNPSPEVKTPALCDSCEGVQRNWRRAPGHAELVQGKNRKIERPHGQVTVTRYVCDRCGTVWDYENNKANLHATDRKFNRMRPSIAPWKSTQLT